MLAFLGLTSWWQLVGAIALGLAIQAWARWPSWRKRSDTVQRRA